MRYTWIASGLLIAALVAMGCMDTSVVSSDPGPSLLGTWEFLGTKHRHWGDEEYDYGYRESWTFGEGESAFGDGRFVYRVRVISPLPWWGLPTEHDTLYYATGEYRYDPPMLHYYRHGGRYFDYKLEDMASIDPHLGEYVVRLWPPDITIDNRQFHLVEK